jgi:hypothetical protein
MYFAMCADMSMLLGVFFFLLVVAAVVSTAVFVVVAFITKWIHGRLKRPSEAEAR